jgi:hypothetical protein
MDPARDLLHGIVDYAGLFPPTGASMEDAVAEYAKRRLSPESWMLAAFVVPVSRLAEFATAAAEPLGATDGPWPLSVLVGPDYHRELDDLAEWIRAMPAGKVGVTALEHRPATPEGIGDFVARASGIETFCELSWDADLAPWIEAVEGAKVRAKLRCGGVTPDLIPPTDRVAGFIRACHVAGIGMKFTAGLHHPVRGEYPLTYEPDAPRAMMHGFLNVFVGSALFVAGESSEPTLLAVLEETDRSAFRIDDEGVAWRDHSVPTSALRSVREGFARSFGSCSFAEPVDDLQQLGML